MGLHVLKSCAWFFAKLVLLYAFLIVVAPILGAPYGFVFRGLGAMTYGTVGDHFTTRFLESAQEERRFDTCVVLQNERSGAAQKLGFSSYRSGYLPMAILAAFVLACPVGRRRRFSSLVLGLVIVQAFALIKLGVVIWNTLTIDPLLQDSPPSKATWAFLEVLRMIVVGWPVAGFLVPIFAGILVTFRRGDWERFRLWAVAPAKTPHSTNRPKRAVTP